MWWLGRVKWFVTGVGRHRLFWRPAPPAGHSQRVMSAVLTQVGLRGSWGCLKDSNPHTDINAHPSKPHHRLNHNTPLATQQRAKLPLCVSASPLRSLNCHIIVLIALCSEVGASQSIAFGLAHHNSSRRSPDPPESEPQKTSSDASAGQR